MLVLNRGLNWAHIESFHNQDLLPSADLLQFRLKKDVRWGRIEK